LSTGDALDVEGEAHQLDVVVGVAEQLQPDRQPALGVTAGQGDRGEQCLRGDEDVDRKGSPTGGIDAVLGLLPAAGVDVGPLRRRDLRRRIGNRIEPGALP